MYLRHGNNYITHQHLYYKFKEELMIATQSKLMGKVTKRLYSLSQVKF
jgi:hypothetical protein